MISVKDSGLLGHVVLFAALTPTAATIRLNLRMAQIVDEAKSCNSAMVLVKRLRSCCRPSPSAAACRNKMPCQSAVRAHTSASEISPEHGSMLRRTRSATIASESSVLPRAVSGASLSMPASSSGMPSRAGRRSADRAALTVDSVTPMALDSPFSAAARYALLSGRARLTWLLLERKRRQLGAIHVAALAAVKDTREYTDR